MRVELTRADIHELMENPTQETRAAIARKVSLHVADGGLSAEEKQLADHILQTLVSDAAVEVRQAIADALKASPHIPREVALDLARDLEQIAVPLLEECPVFTDRDLVYFVRVGTAQKQLAIAGRDEVGSGVCDALVEAGNSTVVARLVSNEGAVIQPQAFERAFERFGAVEEVQGPLANRADLPLPLAEKLVTIVSDHIRETLLARHGDKVALLEGLSDQAREKVIAQMALGAIDPEDTRRLVRDLADNDRLTASLILRTAFMGNLRFVEESFAHLAAIDHAKAWVLVHDKGALGLKALYTETGLPNELYAAFRVAVDVFHQMEYDAGPFDRERFAERSLERTLTQYEAIDAEDIDFLLARLNELTGAQQIALDQEIDDMMQSFAAAR